MRHADRSATPSRLPPAAHRVVQSARQPVLLCLIVLTHCAALASAGRGDEAVEPGNELTVYNQNFAVVKQRRTMQLDAGVTEVRFANVAATIVPESVQFESLRPAGARVLEQNYEFDLVNASKLLQKYIDQQIGIVGRDGSLTEGKLLASDNDQIVLAGEHGIELIPRGSHVKDIRFSRLPAGLLTRPTLVWKVRAPQAGEHLVRVAYQARDITWRVDYRAVASPNQKSLNLLGWVTITNHSGTTFDDARLKLMAGDVHVSLKEAGKGERRGGVAARFSIGLDRKKIQEKSFAEYHLYSLPQPTTLRQAQTKQIELLAVAQIPVQKRYLYRSEFGSQVAVTLQFKNSKETAAGLGIPLPEGPIRVYLPDATGDTEFLGSDLIKHTPKDEPVKIRVGYAFDVKADRVMTASRRRANEKWNEQDWQITLHNHRDQPIQVRVEERLEGNRNWEIRQASDAYAKLDAGTIAFDVELPANGEKKISYTVEYTW